MVLLKGAHLSWEAVLHTFFHLFIAVSWCDLEEIMAERGARVDHVTPTGGLQIFANNRSSRAIEEACDRSSFRRFQYTFIDAVAHRPKKTPGRIDELEENDLC